MAFDEDLAERIRELRVDADGVRTKRQLQRWVTRGVTYARSLPAKRHRRSRRRPNVTA